MTINDISIAIDSTDELNLSVGSTSELSLSVDSTNSLNFDLVQGSGSGGTNDYNQLTNKPRIEDVVLIGNKSFENLGLIPITTADLLEIFSH